MVANKILKGATRDSLYSLPDNKTVSRNFRRTAEDYSVVQKEGNYDITRKLDFYNLDAIPSNFISRKVRISK